MNISSIGTQAFWGNGLNQPQAKSNLGKENQKFTLEAGKTINMGKIDGKPYDLELFKDGGFQWSGGPLVNIKTQGLYYVSAEDQAADRAAALYSRQEHEQANRLSAIVNCLYGVTSRGWRTSYFNEFVNQFKFSPGEVDDALSRLGIDTSNPFTINGRSFTLDSGMLKDTEGK